MMLALHALALVALVSNVGAAGAPTAVSAADTLRVVLVVDDTAAHRSLVEGARLGAEEASHTGALFGTVVTLRVEGWGAFDSTRRTAAAQSRGATTPSLYVVAGDTTTCSRVMRQGARSEVPVLDAGCASSGRLSPGTVYSLIPAAEVAAVDGDSTRVELWHWSLERFGGEQLNERFRRRFGGRMDSPAWTGWLALKIALDAALHAQATDGRALARQLAEPRAQYDGQKGRPLRFSPDTHRLVQPVYRIAGHGDRERVVAEVSP